ncbi:MAG: energy-coupling factor transporter ATPase [Clostridia bacterium]|nr:energy-coupling factor transporter ATPase [Clostridia bacterium]
MAKIKLQDVSFFYGKGTAYCKEALKNVNIEIKEGSITSLIGHTGSGKSTMLQLLNGLSNPSEGKVLLDDVDIWEKPKEIGKVRFRVGLVMQYPEYQLFEETVEKDIAYGHKNMGLNDTEIAERISEAIDFVGLSPDVLQKNPFDLSGGQKRRVAIAGVIAMRPEVLVLDEPAAGLDPRARREILGSLSQYVKNNNASVILVSHSMEDMAYYCDNIVVMKGGEIISEGSVSEVFSRHNLLIDAGLDVPQILRIAERIRALGIDLKGELYTTDGAFKAILDYIGGNVK